MGTILIWGYIDGYNLDLGVCEYSKVENPCLQMFKYLIFLPNFSKCGDL